MPKKWISSFRSNNSYRKGKDFTERNFTEDTVSCGSFLTLCLKLSIIPTLITGTDSGCSKGRIENRKAIKMESKKNILTYEGLRKYEDELHDLKVVKRKEVAQKIKEAREQGDLSENAEYDAAKDEQRDIEARIEELEKILKNAEVVVEDEVDLDKINIGCQVKILDMEYNEEMDYKIVGSTEANSLKGKISNESPVGKALIGSRLGDIVEVETQAGILKYKVLEIQRSNTAD